MIEFFFQLDTIVTTLLSSLIPHTTISDYLFLFLSFNGLTVVIWSIIIILFLIFDIKQHKQFIIYFLLSFLTTSFLVNIVIKNIVQRERPYVVESIDTAYCPQNYSFPSGHAAGAFAGAVVFAYFDKKRKWYYYSVAGLIAYSRIYLYCHYFFDIFFGAFLGYIIAKIFLRYKADNKEV